MINLLLAIHNHQPVGNFGHVFEKAFKQCYWPILNTLAEFPKIKISLHHSGPLLDFAKEHEPNYIPTLVKLIKSGQIEPLGGGYYEPILAIIPPKDASGQLKMMSDFWEATASYKPQGVWMTERIWEPSLTTLLADSGVKYTILDDEHFRAAGIIDDFILNYYLTERHGKTVSIFASDKTLRYQIPFKLPEDVIAHLLYLADKYPGSAITYGDDGEKFGMWPGTHEWVIQKGWLKKFFSMLSEHSDKIKIATISEHYKSKKPSGTVYLPTCSYHEMGEWSIPSHAIHKLEGIKEYLANNGKWEDAKPFVRGGYWDNFLSKYPESNYMHKKMLYVSEKIAKSEARSNSEQMINTARRHLYMAQCNCAYWHGLFGGLYLNYLRHAVFQNLIEAENIIDGEPPPNIEKIDIDCDHYYEIILSNKHLIAVVKPNHGAGLLELSHRKSRLNLRNVLARREEAYHKKPNIKNQISNTEKAEIPSIHDINKDPLQTGPIVYDNCNRLAFCDLIWPVNTNPFDCRKTANVTVLFDMPYNIAKLNKNHVILHAKQNGIFIEKSYHMENEPKLTVEYMIKWDELLKTPLNFGTALNLTLLAGHDDKRYYLMPNGERQMMDTSRGPEKLNTLTLVDEYFGFKLNIIADSDMNIWRYPINTVSQSESGFDLLYQGSCIIWSAVVPAGTNELDFALTLEFK